eukprot:3093659-Rhodomonas_salina.2
MNTRGLEVVVLLCGRGRWGGSGRGWGVEGLTKESGRVRGDRDRGGCGPVSNRTAGPEHFLPVRVSRCFSLSALGVLGWMGDCHNVSRSRHVSRCPGLTVMRAGRCQGAGVIP